MALTLLGGTLNGPHTIAYTKDNAFTRLIARVGERNAMEGKPAGRSVAQAENFVSAIPANRVRSLRPEAAARLDAIPTPLDPREIAIANARAQALGIVGDDEVAPTGPSTDPGGPSEEEIEAMLPARFRTGAPAPSTPIPGAPVASVPSGRPMAASEGMFVSRAMPDFKNVQGFNLERGVAVVDGIEFPIPDQDLIDMKKYALSLVLDMMVIKVAQALTEFGLPKELAEAAAEKLRETAAQNATVPGGMTNARKESGTTQDVHDVPSTTTTGAVPEGSVAQGRSDDAVQGLSADEGPGEDVEWLLEAAGEDVPSDDSGDSLGTATETRVQSESGTPASDGGDQS